MLIYEQFMFIKIFKKSSHNGDSDFYKRNIKGVHFGAVFALPSVIDWRRVTGRLFA